MATTPQRTKGRTPYSNRKDLKYRATVALYRRVMRAAHARGMTQQAALGEAIEQWVAHQERAA